MVSEGEQQSPVDPTAPPPQPVPQPVSPVPAPPGVVAPPVTGEVLLPPQATHPPQGAWPAVRPQMVPVPMPPRRPPVHKSPTGIELAPADQPEYIDGYLITYPVTSPTTSGMAIGSLVLGIGSALISVLVCCVGIYHFVPAIAFTILSGFAGGGAISLGILSRHAVERSGGEVTGRGLAIAGISVGSAGIAFSVIFLVGLRLAGIGIDQLSG